MTSPHAAPAALPYGSWPSPLTAAMLTEAARSLTELRADGPDLTWLERRPDQGGRQVVVRRDADGTVRDATPPDVDVRSRVHEYGGGAYAVRHGVLWYVDVADQRLYRLDPGGTARPLTPAPDAPAAVRFAEPVVTPDGRWVVCVRERHLGAAATDVVNDLVAVPADGDGTREPTLLVSGPDFVASPTVSPDGGALACVVWDHPNMPWDDTSVLVGTLDEVAGTLGLAALERVAGTPAVSESAIEPTWSPDGVLHLLSDRDGWWQLYRVDTAAPEGSRLVRLCDAPVDLGTPRWVGGVPRVAFLADGRIAVVAIEQAVEQVRLIDPSSGTLTPLPVPAGTCRAGIVAHGDVVTAVVGAADRAETVVAVDVADLSVSDLHVSRDLPIGPAWLPTPEPITFPSDAGAVAHALYYRPTNPDCVGPDGERPPLLVLSHGGPTAHVSPRVALDIAYWTSRGFAVADVNYRGSSGYGRTYRQALRGRWGEVDVADCTAVAQWLADRGEVDRARLAIAGGSAGGFTTLSALTFGAVFTAGASSYGVADLTTLAADTHKFESRYLDGLVGPYPAAAEVYEQRSPLRHTDRLSAPMIVLQGLQDRIVPPSQSEAMVAALDAKGIPHAYVTFADEEHGFRRAENVMVALEAELSFFGQVFGFTPAGDVPVVEVRHLDD